MVVTLKILNFAVGFPNLFSIRLHHGGCLTNGYGRAYVGGKINFVDLIDIDRFSVHEIGEMMISLGYSCSGHMYYHFLHPEKGLHNGLEDLSSDQDVLNLAKHVAEHKVINVYTRHGLKNIKAFFNSPTKQLTIEEINDPRPYAIVPARPNVYRNLNELFGQSSGVGPTSGVGQSSGIGQSSGSALDQQEADLDFDDLFSYEWDGNFNARQNNVEGDDNGGNDHSEGDNNVNVEGDEVHGGNDHSEQNEDNGDEDNGDGDYIVDEDNTMDDHEVDMSDYRMNVDSDVEDNTVGDHEDVDLEDEVLDNEKFNKEHTCLQTRNPKSCTSSFIAEQLVEQVTENPKIPMTVVQDQFTRKFEVGVSRMQAYRARAKAKKVVEGDYTKQYAMLRDYALELKDKNPGTTVKFEVYPQPNPSENTRKFKRIYVCLGPLKEGFKALGRDLLGLDGAFMKGPYPGQILTAVGVDCNNGIYPVCYAIVESENLSSWTWFLELLGDDLDLCKQSKFTFISDRQKGLIPAIAKVFPSVDQRYYLRHIHENMKGSFRGKLYKDMLWKSHFSGRALSDVLLNNMCEVYNGKIVQGRDKPIISVLEYIREYLMRRIVIVQKVIEKSEGPLTPNATKMLEAIKKDAAHNHVRWEITGMPCRNAVATIWFKATNGQRVGALESWVNLVYTMERWRQVYSFKVNPLNGMSLWPRCQVPTTLTPPNHHTQVGRPKKARKISALEMDEMTKRGRLSKKNSKGTCGKCGIKGYNVRTLDSLDNAVYLVFWKSVESTTWVPTGPRCEDHCFFPTFTENHDYRT
ncbi:hypothetical protein L1987_64387 [Smallanthus sonchifolius]|uniref:Uncharacterized protein n=1 Tax=Smallanthus sonchifolius TaxID=185202 RepID=A0ACB9CFU8_9ASTR|nr:hypothetical protein L1987_64387 [Smallanthus sonchifolius]